MHATSFSPPGTSRTCPSKSKVNHCLSHWEPPSVEATSPLGLCVGHPNLPQFTTSSGNFCSSRWLRRSHLTMTMNLLICLPNYLSTSLFSFCHRFVDVVYLCSYNDKYVYICMYPCLTHGVCTYMHTYIHTYRHTYKCLHDLLCVYGYIHTQTHTHTHIYIYVHTCVFMYVCMYVCMYVTRGHWKIVESTTRPDLKLSCRPAKLKRSLFQ